MDEAGTSFDCVFCTKKFSSKSTLGRHLDSKKGDSVHPEDEVQRVRGNVVRRGDKKDVQELEARRSKVSKKYNSKLDVKEKNKFRRKLRDQRIKARLRATDWYLAKLSRSQNAKIDTFPAMVAAHLPPNQWPGVDDIPGQEQLNHLLGRVEEVQIIDLGRLYSLFEDWGRLSAEDQRKIWMREVWLALQGHLGGNSLWEISEAKGLVERKQEEILGFSGEILDLDEGDLEE